LDAPITYANIAVISSYEFHDVAKFKRIQHINYRRQIATKFSTHNDRSKFIRHDTSLSAGACHGRLKPATIGDGLFGLAEFMKLLCAPQSRCGVRLRPERRNCPEPSQAMLASEIGGTTTILGFGKS
jgi:hypothetical protein